MSQQVLGEATSSGDGGHNKKHRICATGQRIAPGALITLPYSQLLDLEAATQHQEHSNCRPITSMLQSIDSCGQSQPSRVSPSSPLLPASCPCSARKRHSNSTANARSDASALAVAASPACVVAGPPSTAPATFSSFSTAASPAQSGSAKRAAKYSRRICTTRG